MPCFVLGRKRAILPAFGGFTGLALMQPAAGEQFVAIAGTRLFALPPADHRRAGEPSASRHARARMTALATASPRSVLSTCVAPARIIRVSAITVR